MGVGLSLELRQTTSLVLTPQLQQAIALLQLARPELEATLARECERNPFLMPLEASPVRADAASRSVSSRVEAPADPDGWMQPMRPPAADRTLRAHRTSRLTADGDLPSLEQRLTRPPSLRHHLRAQLVADVREPQLQHLALQLVDLLDDDGYLRESDAELAALFACPVGQVAEARAALQRCEPTGVGARDLAECLALQLAERNRLDPAMQAMLRHLDLVARADFRRLARLCGVDREDLEEMVAELRRLDPRPGARWAPEEPGLTVPDLEVRREGKGWKLELNPAAFPRVAVDRAYYAELTSVALDADTRRFVETRVQEANWLVRALQQRARTILRVGRAILARQRGFLEHGPAALAPLVLRDIAEVTGLHESTVSRAIAGKSVATPHGVFALRYFFTARIAAGDGGEDHAAEAIRVRIRRLIEQEGADNVLSDDQIVQLLAREGVRIARRTVAKYREAMGIPSSVERRRRRALGA